MAYGTARFGKRIPIANARSTPEAHYARNNHKKFSVKSQIRQRLRKSALFGMKFSEGALHWEQSTLQVISNTTPNHPPLSGPIEGHILPVQPLYVPVTFRINDRDKYRWCEDSHAFALQFGDRLIRCNIFEEK